MFDPICKQNLLTPLVTTDSKGPLCLSASKPKTKKGPEQGFAAKKVKGSFKELAPSLETQVS